MQVQQTGLAVSLVSRKLMLEGRAGPGWRRMERRRRRRRERCKKRKRRREGRVPGRGRGVRRPQSGCGVNTAAPTLIESQHAEHLGGLTLAGKKYLQKKYVTVGKGGGGVFSCAAGGGGGGGGSERVALYWNNW